MIRIRRAVYGIAILLPLLLAGRPAWAAKDVVQFGSGIDVAKGESIHDAVCFFCSVHIQGTARGDVVAFFGDVRIEGKADRDVVNFFGDVKAADDTTIGHNLVNFFGAVQLGQNVRVGQDLVVMFGGLRAVDSATVGGERVVEQGWMFWAPFLLLASGVWLVAHEVRWRRRRRRILLGF